MNKESALALLRWAVASPKDRVEQLALSLGYCVLYQVDHSEWDRTLSVPETVGAMKAWIKKLKAGTQDCKRLPIVVGWAANPTEAEDACLQLIQTRMDSWAAFLAIDDAYQATLEERGSDKVLNVLLDGLLVALDQYDEALRTHQYLLTELLTGLPVFHTWLENIPETFRLNLAWWLRLGE